MGGGGGGWGFIKTKYVLMLTGSLLVKLFIFNIFNIFNREKDKTGQESSTEGRCSCVSHFY